MIYFALWVCKYAAMTNWNDLKYLLAMVEHGSFSQAGRVLGVNRTTVARRIAVLEQQFGVTLLEPSTSGYQITSAGEDVLASAREFERQVEALEEKVGGDSAQLSGFLRVAVPLGLGPEFMPELARFSVLYPRVELELVNSIDPMASINQRKADVGIGLGHALPEYLAGDKIANLHRAIYGSKPYFKHHSVMLSYKDHHWVGWGREMSHTLVVKWMQRHVPSEALIPLRVNSWHALREAVGHGLGLGHLWCFLADREKKLLRLSDVIPELTIGLWVFHHADVLSNRRVDVFSKTINGLLAARINDY